MDNPYIFYSFHGPSRWRARDEFLEADVIWRSTTPTNHFDSDSDPNPRTSSDDPRVISKRLPTASRMIPKSGGKSQDSRTIHQSSAPVNVPDWSKIYGTTKDSHSDDNENGIGIPRPGSWESDDEDDDEGGNVIPPHEWIARRQMSSFSVCEGAGRTLKGRDLSRVRNDVLTKTGFLEP